MGVLLQIGRLPGRVMGFLLQAVHHQLVLVQLLPCPPVNEHQLVVEPAVGGGFAYGQIKETAKNRRQEDGNDPRQLIGRINPVVV